MQGGEKKSPFFSLSKQINSIKSSTIEYLNSRIQLL